MLENKNYANMIHRTKGLEIYLCIKISPVNHPPQIGCDLSKVWAD